VKQAKGEILEKLNSVRSKMNPTQRKSKSKSKKLHEWAHGCSGLKKKNQKLRAKRSKMDRKNSVGDEANMRGGRGFVDADPILCGRPKHELQSGPKK